MLDDGWFKGVDHSVEDSGSWSLVLFGGSVILLDVAGIVLVGAGSQRWFVRHGIAATDSRCKRLLFHLVRGHNPSLALPSSRNQRAEHGEKEVVPRGNDGEEVEEVKKGIRWMDKLLERAARAK